MQWTRPREGPCGDDLAATRVMRILSVYGTERTVQGVPYHRLMVTELTERRQGAGGFFLGDSEDEAVALLDGILAR